MSATAAVPSPQRGQGSPTRQSERAPPPPPLRLAPSARARQVSRDQMPQESVTWSQSGCSPRGSRPVASRFLPGGLPAWGRPPRQARSRPASASVCRRLNKAPRATGTDVIISVGKPGRSRRAGARSHQKTRIPPPTRNSQAGHPFCLTAQLNGAQAQAVGADRGLRSFSVGCSAKSQGPYREKSPNLPSTAKPGRGRGRALRGARNGRFRGPPGPWMGRRHTSHG